MTHDAYKRVSRQRTRAREDARTQAFEEGVARRLEDGLSEAMARDLTCWDCGHATGDHRTVSASMMAPTRVGVCLVDGCSCEAFQGAPA